MEPQAKATDAMLLSRVNGAKGQPLAAAAGLEISGFANRIPTMDIGRDKAPTPEFKSKL